MSVVSESIQLCPVPPMTHPYGQHWRQPDPKNFLWERTRVVVTLRELQQLPGYHTSIPTGAYEGKMWQRRDASGHWLCWYGTSPDPERVSINRLPLEVGP